MQVASEAQSQFCENLLCGSSTKDCTCQGAKLFGPLAFSSNEDHEKDYTQSSLILGELTAGPSAVHTSLRHLGRWCSHLSNLSFSTWEPEIFFSLVLSTHRPSLLRVKIEEAGGDCCLNAWTAEYLTCINWALYVRLPHCLSDRKFWSTGFLRVQ